MIPATQQRAIHGFARLIALGKMTHDECRDAVIAAIPGATQYQRCEVAWMLQDMARDIQRQREAMEAPAERIVAAGVAARKFAKDILTDLRELNAERGNIVTIRELRTFLNEELQSVARPKPMGRPLYVRR